MKSFATTVNDFLLLTVVSKLSIFDVRGVPGCTSEFGRGLTLSRRTSLSYRKQSIDLRSRAIDWFLNDRDLRHEMFKESTKIDILGKFIQEITSTILIQNLPYTLFYFNKNQENQLEVQSSYFSTRLRLKMFLILFI